MASGSAPPSEQRAPAGGKEKVAGGGIGRGRRAPSFKHQHGDELANHIVHCEICVVCGDRACNHHYYGIVSCHGCKCFFWRSIKNKMKYICRGNGQCDISPNQRNACRYCRLQRCLKAGMQPEAVRMPKAETKIEKALGKFEEGKNGQSHESKGKLNEDLTLSEANSKCPMCQSHSKQNEKERKEMMADKKLEKLEEFMPKDLCHKNATAFELEKKHPLTIEDNNVKQQQEKINEMLIKKLCQIEMTINEVVDFSENEAPKRQFLLENLFDYPEFLDRFRTQVNYCVRLRRVTEEEIEFCKYRMLTKVIDYISSLSTLDLTNPFGTKCNGSPQLTTNDKIALLRHGFAPLVLIDIATGTSFTTRDVQNLLLLPTGISLSAEEPIVPNTFINQQIVNRCIGSLVRALQELRLDQTEFVMLKLIILALSLDSTETGGIINSGGVCKNLTEEAKSMGTITTTMLPNSHNTNANNGEMGSGYRLSSNACKFVEKLRDFGYSALYQHSSNRKAAENEPFTESCSNSNSSSDAAALRFAKILNILPKLTLLSRDLEEFIRMVHTFPTSRTRPTDPIFFQLFGDIFQHQDGHQNSMANNSLLSPSSASIPSPFCGGNPAFDCIENPQARQIEGQNKEGNYPFFAKTERHYKMEYGGSSTNYY